MSEQKKISTKKVFRFLIGAVLVAVFAVALIAASRQQNNKTIKGLEVRLNDDKELNFLQKKDIETLLLKNRNIRLTQTPVASLDLRLMEEIARTNPWVAKADIYVDNRQVLQVSITQREPVVRIFDVNGGSYYMDSALYTMPVGVGYAYAAPVFTNVPVLRNDSMNTVLRKKIAYMSEMIGRDSFWHAQVTQVEVQPDQTFVLTPLFGNQKIMVGDTDRIKDKLDNVFAFYKNVSDKIGWDKYQMLDARFKGQIVASPAIGYVPPKVTDTAAIPFDDPNKAATASTVASVAVKPVVAKPATAASVARTSVAKPVVKQPVKNTTKPKPTVPSGVKSRQVLQATAKPKINKDKKEVKTNKTKTEAQKPKYIYPGKSSGNH